jgi:hypothetical protein
VDGGWGKDDMIGHLFPALTASATDGAEPVTMSSPEDLLVVAGGGPAFAACFWLISHDAPPTTRSVDPLRR